MKRQAKQSLAAGYALPTSLIADTRMEYCEYVRSVFLAQLGIVGITSETQAQAEAIDQVSVSVRHMDEMTPHNAALVE